MTPGAAVQPVLGQLDLARNRIGAELGAPLVIWVPTFVTAELPFKAPNLWSWLTDRFVFRADDERASIGTADAATGMGADAGDYARHRARLEELLDEVGPDARAELFVASRRHRPHARYDDAEQLLRTALPIYQTIGDRYGVANTLLSLGRTARGRGDFPAAQTLLTDASTRYGELGIDRWAEIARNEAHAVRPAPDGPPTD